RSSRKARRGPLDRSDSPVRGDDRASIDLAAVEQLIRLAHPLQWKMFDQHADFSRLGEADHFHEFGYGAPVGMRRNTTGGRGVSAAPRRQDQWTRGHHPERVSRPAGRAGPLENSWRNLAPMK